MAQKDYSNSRFFAISGIGYGKGDTAEEAVENYVKTQLRNYDAKTTVYKTKSRWEEALRTGDAAAQVFHAPEGATGFTLGFAGLQWKMSGDRFVDAKDEERLSSAKVCEVCSACGDDEPHHVEYIRKYGLCVL